MKCILIGEVLAAGSWAILVWHGLFYLINHLYFIYSEEPGLVARFGEDYKLYTQNVPRWLPRLSAWTPANKKSSP